MSSLSKKLKPADIAEYFIYKSNKENKIITNKKLQKLVYYSQAWSLVLDNKKLFNEPIEAWVHGPVIKSLYFEYKKFGFNPIKKDIGADSLSRMSEKNKRLLESVWSIYGGLDANYLEILTHTEKPWQEAREGLQSSESSEKKISLKTMKSFYSQKLKEIERSR